MSDAFEEVLVGKKLLQSSQWQGEMKERNESTPPPPIAPPPIHAEGFTLPPEIRLSHSSPLHRALQQEFQPLRRQGSLRAINARSLSTTNVNPLLPHTFPLDPEKKYVLKRLERDPLTGVCLVPCNIGGRSRSVCQETETSPPYGTNVPLKPRCITGRLRHFPLQMAQRHQGGDCSLILSDAPPPRPIMSPTVSNNERDWFKLPETMLKYPYFDTPRWKQLKKEVRTPFWMQPHKMMRAAPFDPWSRSPFVRTRHSSQRGSTSHTRRSLDIGQDDDCVPEINVVQTITESGTMCDDEAPLEEILKAQQDFEESLFALTDAQKRSELALERLSRLGVDRPEVHGISSTHGTARADTANASCAGRALGKSLSPGLGEGAAKEDLRRVRLQPETERAAHVLVQPETERTVRVRVQPEVLVLSRDGSSAANRPLQLKPWGNVS